MVLDIFWLEFLREGFAFNRKEDRRRSRFFFFEERRDLFQNRIANNDDRRRKVKGSARGGRHGAIAIDHAASLSRAHALGTLTTFPFLFAAFHCRHSVFGAARKRGRSRQHAESERGKQESGCQPFFHL